MTHPNSPENPATTPPVDSADDAAQPETESSFEDQLAGISDYLKHATLAALAAVAEGHPEQVLDLVGNLITSYEKIRSFAPLVELIEKTKKEREEAFKKSLGEWQEDYDRAWKVADRELDFMKRAKDAGLSEEGCFQLLERTFPVEDIEPEETAIDRSLDVIVQAATQALGGALAGGGGGCGGGCFGKHKIPTLEEIDHMTAPDEQVVAAEPPCSTCQQKMQAFGHLGPAFVQQVKMTCPTCQQKMKAAVDQFMTTHPHMVQRRGQPQPMPGVSLDDLNGQTFEMPGIRPHAPVATIQDEMNAYAREVGNLSQLASVAAHYGAPSVPLGGAQILSQMGVHTGARVHSTYESAGLDPRMVQTSPMPPYMRFPNGVVQPGPLAAYRYDGAEPSIAITLDELVKWDVIKPVVDGSKLSFELGPNAPSSYVAAVLEEADRRALEQRIAKTQRERGPQFSADGAEPVPLEGAEAADIQQALAENH